MRGVKMGRKRKLEIKAYGLKIIYDTSAWREPDIRALLIKCLKDGEQLEYYFEDEISKGMICFIWEDKNEVSGNPNKKLPDNGKSRQETGDSIK